MVSYLLRQCRIIESILINPYRFEFKLMLICFCDWDPAKLKTTEIALTTVDYISLEQNEQFCYFLFHQFLSVTPEKYHPTKYTSSKHAKKDSCTKLIIAMSSVRQA